MDYINLDRARMKVTDDNGQEFIVNFWNKAATCTCPDQDPSNNETYYCDHILFVIDERNKDLQGRISANLLDPYEMDPEDPFEGLENG